METCHWRIYTQNFPAHAPPLQDPILSFSQKSAHVGGPAPPPAKTGPRFPYGKSWISPCVPFGPCWLIEYKGVILTLIILTISARESVIFADSGG